MRAKISYLFCIFIGLFCVSFAGAQLTDLYNLTVRPNVQFPRPGMIQAADGNLYGATYLDESDEGSVYSITPAGDVTTIYAFSRTAPSNGGEPTGLTQGPDGNLYGVAEAGGADSYGAVFRLTPSGTLTVLHSFTGGADGGYPNGAPILASDGNFYGVTTGGSSYGTVYQISGAGTFTTIYTFPGKDLAYPYGPLVQATDGSLYATASTGVTNSMYENGGIFKVSTAGNYTPVYGFTSSQGDRGEPLPALVQGKDGNLYGVYSNGSGAAFRLSLQGAFSILYDFANGPDLGGYIGLYPASDGNLYGFSSYSSSPTVYSLTLQGTATSVFPGQFTPDLALTQATNGLFYGETADGGAGSGYLYSIGLPTPPAPAVQLTFSASNILLGDSTSLSWKSLNSFSTSMQQCYAFVQNKMANAGTWSGKQIGVYDSTTAVYSGSSTLTPGASGTYTYALTCGGAESGFATLTVTTPKVNSPTSVAATPGSVSIGQPVTLTATVAKPAGKTTPTGTVIYSVDGTSIGSMTLSASGIATLTASTQGINPGSYPVIATYSGDTNYNPSASSPTTVIVAAAPTSTALTITPTSVTPPASATFTATVKRSATGATGTPTGSVTFYAEGNITVATANLNSKGVATLSASSNGIAAGTYPITAKYNGDSSDIASTSAATNVTVQ